MQDLLCYFLNNGSLQHFFRFTRYDLGMKQAIKHTVGITTISLFILCVGVLVAFSSQTKQNNTIQVADTTPTPGPSIVAASTGAGFTTQEIQSHDTEKSCWSHINAKVYDLTAYIPLHPNGSSDILNICGKDGSQLYNREHAGKRKPERELAHYYIGDLKTN